MRRRPAMVLALLDAGFPVLAESRRKWTALQDAVALKDKELVKILYARQCAETKAELKSKKELLLDSLQEIPDCDLQLKWELRSPVLGLLLRKYAPSDTYEASLLISDGAYKTKMRTSEKYFKPVKTWFGYDSTEKIEGWKTKIFEASGKMMAITITKKQMEIPKNATWEEYLKLPNPEDVVKEEPVDLTSMDLMANKNPKPTGDEDEDDDKKKKQARKITGKCWMAESFPMSLKNLLPLLDVIGNANKHIARISNFLQKYGNRDLFPVKLQLPLFYTIYALVSFCKFKHLNESVKEEALTDSFYELPAGYEMREFNDAPKRRRTRSASLSFDATEATRRGSIEVQGSDAEILQQMGL